MIIAIRLSHDYYQELEIMSYTFLGLFSFGNSWIKTRMGSEISRSLFECSNRVFKSPLEQHMACKFWGMDFFLKRHMNSVCIMSKDLWHLQVIIVYGQNLYPKFSPKGTNGNITNQTVIHLCNVHLCSVMFFYSTITHLPSGHTTLVWSVDANVPLFGMKFNKQLPILCNAYLITWPLIGVSSDCCEEHYTSYWMMQAGWIQNLFISNQNFNIHSLLECFFSCLHTTYIVANYKHNKLFSSQRAIHYNTMFRWD